jgi:ABC-type branched-subunit amino acid transport system substrate-binding protein
MITPAATNPKVTERNMWNVFRTCGRDDQQGGIAGAIVANRFKGKRVAVIHDKTTYGQGLADETRKAMNAKGLKEVFYEGVNKDDKDFTALVSKLKQVTRIWSTGVVCTTPAASSCARCATRVSRPPSWAATASPTTSSPSSPAPGRKAR